MLFHRRQQFTVPGTEWDEIRAGPAAGLMLSLGQAAIKSWFSGFLVMINNSDPGCNISARPVYLVLQCLQWQHPGTRVRLPRTLQSCCCRAGVCSVCTPGHCSAAVTGHCEQLPWAAGGAAVSALGRGMRRGES